MRLASSVLSLSLLFSLPAASAEPWDSAPFSADPKALLTAADAGPRPRTPVESLLDDTSYVFDAAGVRTLSWHRLYRVLDAKAARGYETATAVWHPWYQDRPELRARVVGPDGRVSELDSKTITESPLFQVSAEVFSDARVLAGPLPGFVDGAIVEVLEQRRDRTAPFRSGLGIRLDLQDLNPVRKIRISIRMPKRFPFHYWLKGTDAPVRTRDEGPDRLVTLEAGPLAEIDAPETDVPRGDPKRASFGFTLATSWKEVAREYSDLVEGKLARADVQTEARRIVGDAKTREEVVNRILVAMKDVRYSGVELGDGAYVPRTPRETLTRGFGDCKDLATLMVALLRASGHPASVALLRVSGGDVEEELPTLLQFDHAIVRVEGAKPLWVDPTAPEFQSGTLPPADQGRQALVANAQTAALERIPLLPSAQNLDRVVVEFQLAESGSGTVHETHEGHGWVASAFKALSRRSERERRESTEQSFRRTYDVETISTVDQPECQPADACRIGVAGTGSKKVMTGDVDAVAVLEPFAPFWEVAAELRSNDDKPGAKARQQPLEIVPGVVEVNYLVKPPLGFHARTMPPPLTQALGPGCFTATATTRSDGSVAVIFRIDTVKSIFTPGEVTDFRKATNALRLDTWSRVVFDSDVALALKEGKTKEALQQAQRLATQQPRVGAHQARLARVLLEAGFGDLARDAARRGTELTPQDPVAWRSLGFALEHDSLGRRMHPQFDLAGAVAAYRKAKTLKPEPTTVGAMAWVLEHNAQGERWGRGAGLEEAIAEYREFTRLKKSHDADPFILAAELYLRKYDEVLTEAPQAPQTAFRDQVWVTAVAARKGVPAALSQAEQLTASDDLRRALLLQTVPHLLRLQAYPEASALFHAGQGAQADAQSRLADAVLPSLKTRDKWGISSGDPRLLVARLLEVALDPESSPKAIQGLLATEALDETKPGDLKVGSLMLRAVTSPLRGLQLPREVLLDFCMASIDWTASGDGRVGWRLRGTVKNSANHIDLYVVREGDDLKLLGAAPGLAPLGVRALRLIKLGQPDQARQWLTWARDSITELPNSGGDFWLSYLELSHATDLASDAGLLASATVLALHGPSDVGVDPIAEVRRRAGERLASSLDWLLAAHFAQRSKWQTSLEAAEHLASLEPSSSAAFTLRTAALIRLGRAPEAENLANSRLVDLPADEIAPRTLVAVEYSKGDVAGARKLAEARRAGGRATVLDYNQLAWDGLVLGLANDDIYECAQRASQLTNGKNSAVLNTYAAVSAATGRPAEARKLLLETLAAGGDAPLRASDWLVLGLIAEQYGLTDAAKSAFDKTVSSESPEYPPVAASVIAKARLVILAIGPAGNSPAH
ncbi:MAG: DUF3857 domain-containing protein [Myxococcaceae bacterium]